MSKKKKKRSPRSDQASKGKSDFGYKPFAHLKTETASQGEREPEPTKEGADPISDRDDEEEVESDRDALEQMMRGATPMEGGPDRYDDSREISRGPERMSDSELVMRHLDELVYGNAPFELADTDEYIEGAVQGLDRRIVKRLRRGEFSIQAHLDLHGYRREEARLEVARFVERSVKAGKRCVLIVHGRGMRSKDNIPVLKEKLTSWLTRGAMSRRVLAFTSARQWDGGVGAVYVLLRG